MENRERIKAEAAAYYHANKEAVAEQREKFHKLNPEARRKQRRDYYHKASAHLIANEVIRQRKERQADPEGVRLWYREYRKNNPEKMRELSRRAREKFSEIDLLKVRLRARVYQAVKKARTTKSGKTFDLIGCTAEFARGYIEAQFKPGMTWANHGMHGWHIDHKIPCAHFDLTDPTQQRACFHFSNLQPLWALDNLLKSDKMPNNP